MGKGTVAGLGAVVLAAGGITAGTLSGGEEAKDVDGGVAHAIVAAKNIEEYEARPRAFVASNGRRIRVVGVEGESTTVQNSDLGRVVVVDEIPDDAICPVVFHADAKEVEGKMWPDLDGIEWGMRPVPLGHSKQGNNYVWNSFVEGQANCEAMLGHPNYLGSSMAELLALPDKMKARCLVRNGACNVDGQIVTCSVPWGDPRADVHSKIRFPHRLAGRKDINLVHAAGNGTPEDRIPEPEGGWGAEIEDAQPVDGGIGEIERP